MTPAENEKHDQFLRLYVEHEDALNGFVRSLVPTREDAREVMQEVAVVLWRKFEELPMIEDFRRWSDVMIEAGDRQGLLRDISEVFAKDKMNVTGVKTQSVKDPRGGTAWMTFTVEVADSARLAQVLAQVARVGGVRSARRR